MDAPLKITLIQTSLHWENRESNIKMFDEKISSLTQPTDIIVLPEMFSTGFSMNASVLAESMEGRAVKWMRGKAAENKRVITGSLIIEDGGNYYNRLVWMKPDGNFFHYDKRHLFRLAHEEKT